jgi:hypothetical protein
VPKKSLIFVLAVFSFLTLFSGDSYARRSRDILPAERDYYRLLRNTITKYDSRFDRVDIFMRGFYFDGGVASKESMYVQEICRIIRKSIFNLEDHRAEVAVISYFVQSLLPALQAELYNERDLEVVAAVLDIIVKGVRAVRGISFEAVESLYTDVIGQKIGISDLEAGLDKDEGRVGALLAQLYTLLLKGPPDFEGDYENLQRIVQDANAEYYAHTKHNILKHALQSIIDSPETLIHSTPQLELIILGTEQSNLFIKAHSIYSLVRICFLEGLSEDLRASIFYFAVEGVKRIPWDIYFDRNGDIPEEVNYLSASIDHLADAEEVCRVEFGLDVDLAEDSDFTRIYRLLLMRGFNLKHRERLLN